MNREAGGKEDNSRLVELHFSSEHSGTFQESTLVGFGGSHWEMMRLETRKRN